MKVELIYLDGCPNVARARTNLTAAIRMADVQPQVVEWEVNDPNAPAYAVAYGSPTVLVDGRDVTGAGRTASGSACRADGAPTVGMIHAALSTSPMG